MKPTAHIRPVSYVKAHAAELIRQIQEAREPVIVTRNGEAKAVLQDIASYEEDRETLALLKILALGNDEVVRGKTRPAATVFADLRKRLALRGTEP
ncbi:type II toxin-antitoxin system Phd/YefM family antitoxin [Lamprocystis purpurea]|jgi:prevent-host-death family protein|uniref:type II toxin-antitoxin system Phd/YefM family antitoxin n=1 Tax=Lamprocystis purpurea TaxID=61598 RepID=UPI000362F785|nr:type II toxin-antitoxin system Phd/YefM family antitoxin [Lamprocystis purpurea]